MDSVEMTAGVANVTAFHIEPAGPSDGEPQCKLVSLDLTFELVKAADGKRPPYPVASRPPGCSNDVVSSPDSQGSRPACQLSALIDELVSSANHLATLSRRFPSLAPSDADAICAHAIQALLAKLNTRSGLDYETGSRKSSVRVCVENYIKRNLSSKNITPDLIYRQLEIPRSTLYKAFAETGGVAKYIQDQRLDVARSLLLHPEEHRSLNQIADSLGFKTSARFSKAFRRRFGSSPRQMRKISLDPATGLP